MSPLDYLRAMTRRQKPATGGIVRYDPDKAPVVLSGCQYPAHPTSTTYEGVTVQMRGYTELTDEERRQFLDAMNAVMGRPKPGPAKREQAARAEQDAATVTALEAASVPGCPCGIVYSRCYYPVIHAATGR